MRLVVENFVLGLERKRIDYSMNPLGIRLGKTSKVICFGLGLNGIRGLPSSKPVIAAIGFPFPWNAPDLCERFNIRKYLQHSEWALELVKSVRTYPDSIFGLWAAGVDTETWVPAGPDQKTVDVLIYDKLYWERQKRSEDLLEPIRAFLRSRRYSFAEIRYGYYDRDSYIAALSRTKAMIFLSAHETQGFAYQESLSSGVPVMAWNQGFWLDPERFLGGLDRVRATSVPFFDDRCGLTFTDYADFESKFEVFFGKVNSRRFRPRDYVLENLSIEKSTGRLLEIHRAA